MHQGIKGNDGYPDFVWVQDVDHCNEKRLLEICGQVYTAGGYDHYIDTAIKLAAQWQQQQVTYDRVVHLGYWIRENDEHQVPVTGAKSMLGCKEFVDRVIAADYVKSGGSGREDFIRALRENERIFFDEGEFLDTD